MAERTLEEEFCAYLETLPIQTLRTLSRRLGSAAASRKNKPQCIEGIVDLLMGRAEPVPDSGKGAPVKQNYLDPSIIRHLEELRLARERAERREEPNAFVVHAPARPKSLYDETVLRGFLEIMPGGYGFLRSAARNTASGGDVFIAAPLIHSMQLREADLIACTVKDAVEGEPPSIDKLLSVNGIPFGEYAARPRFEELTPCFPEERISLSSKSGALSLRELDLFVPVGKGQRALIAAPPGTGKTTLFREIGVSCARMQPDVELMVLLIDVQPEEVTECKAALPGVTIVSSTFDEEPQRHIRAAEFCIAHAKRLAEHGRNAVVLLDSLDRLARAYHYGIEGSGRTLPGGLDAEAFTRCKRLFAAARNTKEAGSITILASTAADTGNRTDAAILEGLEGTVNCEIVLSRELAERRIFPAIDLKRSGTRKQEKLLTQEQLNAVLKLREAHLTDDAACILELMKNTKDNAQFLEKCAELHQR